MKAAVLYAPGDLRVTAFPEPILADDGVKIAVHYCGLCGTDFHKFHGQAGSRPVTYPVPLGHEVSGVVVQVGKDVSRFHPGDRVTVDPNWSCGRCWYCQNGLRHLCEASRGVVKGMAEIICPPEENVYRLPEGLSLRDAALTEPLSCCLHGVDLLDVRMGQTVAIVGLGAIGQMLLQLLVQSAAAQVIVIEPVEEKRERALAMGATLFINPQKEDPLEALQAHGVPCVERVIESGGIPATAETALRIAGRGATVVLFSVNDRDAVLPIRPYELFYKELTIKTSYINPATTQRAIALLAGSGFDANKAISGVIPLDALPEEIASRRLSRLGKVIVQVSEDP